MLLQSLFGGRTTTTKTSTRPSPIQTTTTMFFTIFALFIASPMLVALLLSAAVPFAAAAPSFAAPPAMFHSRRAESDGPCVPPFNGVGVSVTNSAREWGVKQPPAANASVTSESSNPNTASMLAKVDFFFHPIEGDDDSLFTIRCVPVLSECMWH